MSTCIECGKKGLKWRSYNFKWVLTVSKSGIKHKCPIPIVKPVQTNVQLILF